MNFKCESYWKPWNKRVDKWLKRVEEISGMDFFQLDERHLDPYGCFDEGMSAEDFVSHYINDEIPLVYVFVYGTLKVGGRLSRSFDPFRKKSLAARIKGFHLYNLGSFPGIVEGDGEVIGELHGYTQKDIDMVLRRMDGIEGYRLGNETKNMYNRITVEAEIEGTNNSISAEVYIWNDSVKPYTRIESGEWEAPNGKKD